MAYLALLWKARTIEKYRLKYEKEKINSVNSDKAELRSTLYQKWTVYHNDSQKKLGKFCRNCCPGASKRAHCCTFLIENSSFLLKIVIGMVGGILTYFLYKIFVYQESVWTALSWIISVAIILGVSFNYRVRCLVLLLVPGLFSRVGRYTLACYALVLILTGPAANTLKNLDTLSVSLACGQGEIKSSVKEMTESKDSPLNLVKETMSATVEEVERLAMKMKEMMVVIHRLTMSIAHVLQSSLSWLNSVETICNAKIGTPYEHCANILAEGTKNCQTRFPELSHQWNWDLIVRSVCFTLRPGALCVLGDFAKGSIVATVKKKLQTYSNRVQSLFNMGVHIRRSHTACCNGSLPVSQAAAGIVTDLRNRADTILAWLSWTFALTGLFLMMIIFRAKYYLHMFRTRSRFDNRYVTKELRELDLKRQRQGRETVLPLNTRERAKYVSTASFRLLPSEKMYLTRSIVFMVITTLKLMIHMVADYSLYWVLMSVRFHGCDHTHFRRMSAHNRTARIVVSGSGPLAGTVRMLAAALGAPLTQPATTTNCLPNPNPPDLRRYAQIGTLILLLWLLALFEPYGLRLRHVISGHYEPERAKARAVWLYYHIIRTRSCFLKFARRKLHRHYKYTSEEKLTFKRWLHDCIPCRWLRILLRVGPAEPHCLLCYTKHRQSDLDRHLKRCETPCCPGVYCARCFMDIGQLCTICYSPEDYGDLSDVSLEKFTSDDSEGDNSDGDDNKPLMGTRDKEIEQGGTCSNINKRNKREPFLTTRRMDGNQESMPLLDCDYLKKDYTQQGMIYLKHINTQKQKVASQAIITGLKAKDYSNNENMSSNIIQSKNLSDKFSKLRMIFMDTEVTVNGITFPKGKLGAIVRTMLLLTSKDDKYSKFKKDATKHKPFEYLVMEMFQPSGIFQKIIPATLNEPATSRPLFSIQEIDEPVKSEVLYSFSKLKTTEAISNRELQKDFNFNNTESIMKYIQNGSQNKHKSETISKRFKKMRCSRGKAKRFLDLKKTITDTLRQKISNSRSSNRRRRSIPRFKYLSLISTVSKVFSNKLIKYGGCHSLHDTLDLNIEENKPPINMNKTVERRNPTQPVTIHQADQENQSSQRAKRRTKNNVQNLGNIATGDSISIQSVDRNRGECQSKATHDGNGIETDNNLDHKTMEVQSHLKKPIKLGFWESLRLKRRRNRSPLLFYRNAKDDSVNNLANHKTRKKSLTNENINNETINARNLNNDVQSYRVNSCGNDVELGGQIGNNNTRTHTHITHITDMENNKMSLGPGRKETEKTITNKEITDNKHGICPRRLNEGETKKNKMKPISVEGNQTDKKKGYEVPSASEFVFLYDETTNEPSGKVRILCKKLKCVLSQIAVGLSKRSKACQSFYFNDVESKHSKTNLNENKPCKYRVESNDDLRKDLPHYEHFNVENSTEEAVSEDSVETLQDYNNQEEEQTECSDTVVSCMEVEPHFESDSNIHTCIHEWTVRPKVKEKCQKKESNNGLKTEKTKKTENNTDGCCCQCEKISKRGQMKDTESIEKKDNAKKRGISENCMCCKCKFIQSKGESKKKGSSDESSSHSLKNKKVKNSKGKPKDKGSSEWCPKNKNKSNKNVKSTGTSLQSLENSNKTKKEACKNNKESRCIFKDKISKNEPETEESSDDKSVSKILTDSDSLQNLKNKIVYKAIKKRSNSYTRPKFFEYSKKTQKGTCTKKIKDEIEERLLWASDICNHQAVLLEYANERTPKPKRRNLTSTANRSTTTLSRTVADVSTCTSDWWSPLLERKAALKRTGLIKVEKNIQEDAVLSASKYLMQSDTRKFCTHQMYALEMSPSHRSHPRKSHKFCTQQMYSMKMGPLHRSHPRKKDAVTEKPSFKHNHRLHKGNKIKRKIDCHSGIKHATQSSSISLSSTKWWPIVAEEQAHALRHYTRRYSKSKTNWKSRQIKQKTETCENSLTSSCMWTASTFSIN